MPCGSPLGLVFEVARAGQQPSMDVHRLCWLSDSCSPANGFIPPWYLHVSRGSQHDSEWVLVQLELTHAEGNGYSWVLKVFVPLPSRTI